MKTVRPVMLVGMMGSGKTTIGKLLARSLGREFIDLDQAIVKAQRMPIPAIFKSKGEAAFRQAETRALKSALKRRNAVISSGGGIVSIPENRRIAKAATVVYLRVSAKNAFKRLNGKELKGRPLLKGPRPLKTLEALLAARRKYYAMADKTVSGLGQPTDIVARIAKRLGMKAIK